MIALVDCNSFFVSCERLFEPKLKNKPVVVLSNNDGCIISLSKEAKALGIPMGAPLFKYRDLIKVKKVVVRSSNYVLYADISKRVMETLEEFSPSTQVYSIDEAFLDCKGVAKDKLHELAQDIHSTVKQWVGIPVSVGIGSTKTLSKVANQIAKRSESNIEVLSTKELVEVALSRFAVEDIWGIGRKRAEFLRARGFRTAKHLTEASDAWVKKNLTLFGLRTVKELRGFNCISLKSDLVAKKSIRSTRSFGKKIVAISLLKQAISYHIARVGEKLRRQNTCTESLGLYLETSISGQKRGDFLSGSAHLATPLNSTPELLQEALAIFERIYQEGYLYRKVGITAWDIVPDNFIQMQLFEPYKDRAKMLKTLDLVNERHGRDTLRLAEQVALGKIEETSDQSWQARRDFISRAYTTRWDELLVLK